VQRTARLDNEISAAAAFTQFRSGVTGLLESLGTRLDAMHAATRSVAALDRRNG